MQKPQVNFEEQVPQIMAPPPKPQKTVDNNGDPYIELVTGNRFYYNKPEWDIGAIAHSLAQQCRFTGHCRKFYSVAEHSVLVSRIMEDLQLGDPMEGLMHDAVESVIADIARPAKQLLKDYKALDKALDASMRKAFGLCETMSKGCIHADALALKLEAAALLPSKGVGPCWIIETPLMKPEQLDAQASTLTYLIHGMTSEVAKQRFMARMSDVRRRVRGLR
jgi:uncharacterized protein